MWFVVVVISSDSLFERLGCKEFVVKIGSIECSLLCGLGLDVWIWVFWCILVFVEYVGHDMVEFGLVASMCLNMVVGRSSLG